MKEAKCHAIAFLPSENPEEQAIIQGLHYKDEGEIDDGFSQLEQFEAVLSCPFTYSDRMYHGNYFGVVAKKTSTSSEVVESLLEKIGDLVYGGSDERNLEQNSFKANT